MTRTRALQEKERTVPIRVQVIDRQPLSRRHLISQLDQSPEILVVGTAADRPPTPRAPDYADPEVVLLDADQDRVATARLLRAFRQQYRAPV